ncbi:hypothetical protein EAG_14790 [Camponotus floridanus]|uniref:Uncharacterized protein n=1 Tax=Camponotus floridanus TaxID=104421 RepID=E2A5I7_CAMFO|nr:hypothetical protein EAG_14790 [Camponotus floridanus]
MRLFGGERDEAGRSERRDAEAAARRGGARAIPGNRLPRAMRGPRAAPVLAASSWAQLLDSDLWNPKDKPQSPLLPTSTNRHLASSFISATRGRFNNDDDEAVARDVEPVLRVLSVVYNSAGGALVLGSVSPVKRERRRLLVRTRGTANREEEEGEEEVKEPKWRR